MTTSMDPRWAFSLIAGLLVAASAGAQTAPAVPGNTAGQSTAAAPAPAQTRIGLALRGAARVALRKSASAPGAGACTCCWVRP